MGSPDYAATSHKDLNYQADLLYNSGSPMDTQFAGPTVVTPPAGHNSLDRVNSTQPVSEMVKEPPTDRAAHKAKVSDTALLMQDNDHEGDQIPCHRSQTVAPMNPHYI
jgi:hypothetical protein